MAMAAALVNRIRHRLLKGMRQRINNLEKQHLTLLYSSRAGSPPHATFMYRAGVHTTTHLTRWSAKCVSIRRICCTRTLKSTIQKNAIPLAVEMAGKLLL
jgi:hypothetical protein